MKKLECIVRPTKVDEVIEALEKVNVSGITISEVYGYGKQKGHTEVHMGVEYEVKLLKKVKLELVVEDERVDNLLNIIENAAKTGEYGDGKVFVSSIEDSLRIRTSERGAKAIQ